MSKRHLQRILPGRVIEMLEQRRLLSAAFQLAAVAPQDAAATGRIVGRVLNDVNHDFRRAIRK